MKRILDFSILALLLIIDQVSKYLVSTKMTDGDTLPVINNFLHITYVQNKGVAFGLFYGQIPLITFVGVAAIIGIIVYSFKHDEKFTLWTRIALMVILAGAIGNLYDRVFRHFVVDFIDFRGIWHYIFNIADVCINVGVAMIFIESLRKDSKKELKEETK